jgi:hypothetical protein
MFSCIVYLVSSFTQRGLPNKTGYISCPFVEYKHMFIDLNTSEDRAFLNKKLIQTRLFLTWWNRDLW